jgi:hypothetical protein
MSPVRHGMDFENRKCRVRFSWWPDAMIGRDRWLSEVRSALKRSRVVALLAPQQSGTANSSWHGSRGASYASGLSGG